MTVVNCWGRHRFLVEGEGSGRDGEIETKNRSLFSCRRVPRSVPALSHYCGRRRTHRRLVDFHTLANFRADNVCRSGRRYSRSSNCLSDFRSDECGRIRPHRGPCLALLSSVLLTRKLKGLVFLTSRYVSDLDSMSESNVDAKHRAIDYLARKLC
jgi:hypothetical protein